MQKWRNTFDGDNNLNDGTLFNRTPNENSSSRRPKLPWFNKKSKSSDDLFSTSEWVLEYQEDRFSTHRLWKRRCSDESTSNVGGASRSRDAPSRHCAWYKEGKEPAQTMYSGAGSYSKRNAPPFAYGYKPTYV